MYLGREEEEAKERNKVNFYRYFLQNREKNKKGPYIIFILTQKFIY